MQQWIVGIWVHWGGTAGNGGSVGWLGSGHLHNDLSVFVWCGVAFAVADFIHAWFGQTEHFFDLTGSLTYIVLVLAASYLSAAFDRSFIVGLVLIWALRLGPFLFFGFKRPARPPLSQ